ncbi:hypothetical protein TWF569_010045 [Orbilia oligospora]|nr:hypothetical protein TWF569_010045 [Orbilia oligospora]
MTSQQKFPAFFACLESPFLLSSFGIGSILTHKKNSNTATGEALNFAYYPLNDTVVAKYFPKLIVLLAYEHGSSISVICNRCTSMVMRDDSLIDSQCNLLLYRFRKSIENVFLKVPDEMTLYVSPRLGRKSVKPSTVNSVKDRVIVLSR